MNEMIDQFCASKRRWLIVTIVTTLVGLVTLTPLVDYYSTICAENAELGSQLGEINRVADGLAQFEQRVRAKQQELEEMGQRTVTEADVGEFRNRLIGFARESGCQVRRISFGAVRRRPWFEKDSVLEPVTRKTAGSKLTPFAVETRPVTLSVAGTNASVKKLLERLQSDQTLRHVKFFELRPANKSKRSVQMDLELWCYSLERASV